MLIFQINVDVSNNDGIIDTNAKAMWLVELTGTASGKLVNLVDAVKRITAGCSGCFSGRHSLISLFRGLKSWLFLDVEGLNSIVSIRWSEFLNDR